MSTFSIEQLRGLYSEIAYIGSYNSPALADQSVEMKSLFEIAKTKCDYFYDQYASVKNKIELEILRRFKNNTL